MTIKDLCDMVVAKGECKEPKKIRVGKEELYTCIGECKKLDGFMKKYWDKEVENDGAAEHI